MGRSVGIVTLVVSLVMSAVLFVAQWSSRGGPGGTRVDTTAPIARANTAAAETEQVLAERELAAYQAEHGTFSGAQVTDLAGVTVRYGDDTRFCLQVVTNGVALYEAGPDGSLSPQPC
jgi:hypothetical protein